MNKNTSVSAEDLRLAREFVRRLGEHVNPESFSVTLYGSRARGDAEPDSDLDLFVAVVAPAPEREVEKAADDIACDMTLQYGLLICPLIADQQFISSRQGYSFFDTLREEGVPV